MRWVAVRHAPDHIHLVATLARAGPDPAEGVERLKPAIANVVATDEAAALQEVGIYGTLLQDAGRLQ